MADFKNGNRKSADPRKANTNAMIGIAKAMTDEEVKAAADYFGAARSAFQPAAQPAAPASESPAKAPPANKPLAGGAKEKTESKLSAADQKLAEQQKTCPVTDLPLDSMGGPVAVAVAGQKVFICCQGCEARLKKDPQKYLAKIKNRH